MASLDYKRRKTHPVVVGSIGIGADNPIRIQSMTNTSTMDTESSVEQAVRMIGAGAELVRLTAQGTRESNNIGLIREELRKRGYEVPLVADIHFNPHAAYAAIGNADKIRINPGNFVDPGRTFKKIDYTEEEYAAELDRLEASVVPFLNQCRDKGTAIRIGVNHGSLSDRIMSRYGDTPGGMAESALEFLRICKRNGFDDVVVSIKASNVAVMVETVRLLVTKMSEEDMTYPLHLGVTEAGDGEDARIKSAIGIGTLLLDGIGDTIRVSLSEAPEHELPVARMLVDYVDDVASAPSIISETDQVMIKSLSEPFGIVGGNNVPVVIGESSDMAADWPRPDFSPGETAGWYQFETPLTKDNLSSIDDGRPIVLTSKHPNFRGAIKNAVNQIRKSGIKNPVVLRKSYGNLSHDEVILRAAVEFGSLLLDGYGDGVFIESDKLSAPQCVNLSFKILQSARKRITSTDYIACPGCGRTLFDLQTTLAEVKNATKQLKGLKIAVMGCIVNGPGEMADADYGYVGAGTGKISLYRGKECVEKNIPQEQAVKKLLELIASDSR